jgi:hypothetical protein
MLSPPYYTDYNNIISDNNNMKYVINPKSGRKIGIGGRVYNSLIKEGYYLRGSTLIKRKKSTNSKSRGCSGMAKNKRLVKKGELKKSDFCGPEGDSCPYTFPVSTRAQARAALSYARHAPNPAGIRRCVIRKAMRMGWIGPDGKIKQR